MLTAINWIKFCKEHDIVPVVSIKSSYYYDGTDDNLFELVFKPVAGIAYQDAMLGNNVAIAESLIGCPGYSANIDS